MPNRDDLVKILEEYHLSHIQSEAEVSSKLIVSLINWLGYPSQFRAEQFPVYGNGGGTPLPAKPADFVLFDDALFAKNRMRKQKHLDWVKNHSLLIIEAKKPGEMPDIYGQAQFYANWTKSIGYIYIDGNRIIGFLLSNKTADIPIIDCDISTLADNEYFLQFSYENIKCIKDKGIDQITSLVPIQYKEKISRFGGQPIPENDTFLPMTRYIVSPNYSIDDNNPGFTLPPFEILKHDKYIVLLAGAGQGKTFFLQQVCREAASQDYHPFFFSLHSITEDNIIYSLAQNKIRVDEKVVFAFDGFDEMAESQKSSFITAIEEARGYYPELLFIISTRENAYSNQFPNALPYVFTALTNKEIEAFVVRSGIDLQSWNKEIEQKDLKDISAIPFYLSSLIEIWQMEGILPDKTQLMRHLIQLRIKADIFHVYTQSTIQRQHLADTKKAFENIALLMQCMHRYYLTMDEINSLFTQEAQDILSCHGIWVKNADNRFFFSHNNYREFLAAEVLSRMDLIQILGYIANPPHYLCIRPTWINVLSYLTDLYRPNDLLEWIFDHQPELITLFEEDRIPETRRTDILKKILDKSKEQNTWLHLYRSVMSELVLFCDTPASVNYVVTELQQSQTERHRHNLLRCLEFFTTYYESEEIIKSIVIAIAFCETESVDLRCDAFKVMSHHPDLFIAHAREAAELIFRQDDEFLKYNIISFIQSTGNAETYIEAIIDAFDKYDYRKHHLISLKLITKQILINIQGIDAACNLIRYYPRWTRKPGIDRIDLNDFFRKCCDLGIENYDGENNCFLLEILSLFQSTNLRFLNKEMLSILINYIENTNTAILFIDTIIANQPSSHHGFILSQLVCNAMVDAIEKKIHEHSIGKDTVEDIIRRLPYKCLFQTRLVNSVYFNMHEQIVIDPPVDYENQLQSEHQRFFEALFSQDLFDELVKELLGLLGKDAKLCEDSFNKLFFETRATHLNEALYDCYFALRELVPENVEMKISEYPSLIENWDEFCFSNASHCLHNHSVVIDETKKQYLSDYCRSIFEQLDIETAIRVNGNSLSLPPIIPDAARIFASLSVKCSEDLAIKLLLLPPTLFDDNLYNQLPECITSQIEPENLQRSIIDHIHNNLWNCFIAPGFILYCKDSKISECRHEITQFALDHKINNGYAFPALDYLEELFGIDSIINDILPSCNNEDLLSELSARIPNNISSPLLDQKLWEAYNNKKEKRWFVQLIKHNNLSALQEYYSHAKELQTLPDWISEPNIPEATEAIYYVSAPSCICLLVDLYVLSNNPRFTDREFFGLKHSCWHALKTIANDNYDQTKEAIINSRTNDKSITDIALQDLLEAIEENQKSIQDKPFEFDFARRLIFG